MKFLKVMSLRGPNIWTYRPVLEAWVDIGDLEDSPSNTIPGFYERLSSWLPALIEHRCGVGERGGFLLRLREGTWPGHILEHVTHRTAEPGRHADRFWQGARDIHARACTRSWCVRAMKK